MEGGVHIEKAMVELNILCQLLIIFTPFIFRSISLYDSRNGFLNFELKLQFDGK